MALEGPANKNRQADIDTLTHIVLWLRFPSKLEGVLLLWCCLVSPQRRLQQKMNIAPGKYFADVKTHTQPKPFGRLVSQMTHDT